VGRRWVVNASPIILLGKAGVIHLVPRVCERLIIPAGTMMEVQRGNESDAGRAWLMTEGVKFVAQTENPNETVARFGLGLGETQVLAWLMRNRGFEGVLDDLRARRCAAQLGLPIIGSLRVLIILKEQKLIPAIKPAIASFREAGSYISESLIERALKLAGED
jgi:predicted nucleic acid-binding protein